METPRVVLLVLILIFVFVSPDTRSPSNSQQYELNQLIAEERYVVDLLNSSYYGNLNTQENRWINVTGFREGDGYAWDLLPQVQARAREMSQKALDIWNLSPSGRGSAGILPSSWDEAKVSKASQNTSSSINSPIVPAMYQNVTGIIRGHWTRSKITDGFMPPKLNLTAVSPRINYVTEEYGRNATGKDGSLRIQFDEKNSETLLSSEGFMREISAELTIRDDKSSGDGYEMTLYGVHYPQKGSILLSTTSPKFAGIFALPHLALSGTDFALAQKLLNKTLTDAIKRQEYPTDSASLNPWSSSPNSASNIVFPTPRCEYIAYLQQHRTGLTGAELSSIEEELRYPTGASLPAAPFIKMSAVIFSPDCGFVLESKGPPDYPPQSGMHLSGPKIESYIRLGRLCTLVFALLVCGQIFLLIRQMKDTSTPSTRSRVSFYTIAAMAMGDGFASIGFMHVSMLFDSAFLPLISTAFLALLCVNSFGMKFLMDIWTVQAPERQERERREATANPLPPSPVSPAHTPAPVVTAAGADTLPLPVTARRPTDTGATPISIPPDQDLGAAEAAEADPTPQTTLGSANQGMGALYSRFCVLMFSILFLSLHAMSWPNTLRSIYANLFAFVYLSFWLPQIHRNVIRNCRKALRWEFVIGQSILRLAPIVYLYTVDGNVLFIKTDTNALFVLIGWVWLQVWALVSQEMLGPRFFVPTGWAPPAYDYHPILREEYDEESGASLPIGFTQSTTSPSSSATTNPDDAAIEKGKRIFDCAICMQNLEVPVVPPAVTTSTDSEEAGEAAASSLATTIFSRRAYMVTPCRHIFHSACLEGWMRYRLQCPICRENLPPL